MSRKIRYELIPPEFLDVVLALEEGARKYGEYSWLKPGVIDHDDNKGSMWRHFRDVLEDKDHDEDSGIAPELLLACRALMRYTLRIRKRDLVWPEHLETDGKTFGTVAELLDDALGVGHERWWEEQDKDEDWINDFDYYGKEGMEELAKQAQDLGMGYDEDVEKWLEENPDVDNKGDIW